MSAASLPVHPVTGLTALGWRAPRHNEDPEHRYPIWPILGAAPGDDEDDEDEDETDPAGDGQDDDADPDGAEDLGDKGKKALDAMKAKLKGERERRKAAESERDQLKAKPAGDGTDPEHIRAEADKAAAKRANARIVRSELKAAATGKLTDPRDALAFIDLEQFDVDEDGQVDEDEVAEAIDKLLNDKPHLAAAKAPRFQGSGDGGARKGSGGPKQLGKDDLKNMSAEQIEEARMKGQLRDYLRE